MASCCIIRHRSRSAACVDGAGSEIVLGDRELVVLGIWLASVTASVAQGGGGGVSRGTRAVAFAGDW
jgi:hypothetical protein